MRKHPFFVVVMALSLLTAGCKEKNDVEAGGQACLVAARSALQANDFAGAKQQIERLRKEFPLALNAREQGILLLDSIDLAEARVQLKECEQAAAQPDLDNIARDTLNFNLDRAQQKVKFFLKKLDHDRENIKKH